MTNFIANTPLKTTKRVFIHIVNKSIVPLLSFFVRYLIPRECFYNIFYPWPRPHELSHDAHNIHSTGIHYGLFLNSPTLSLLQDLNSQLIRVDNEINLIIYQICSSSPPRGNLHREITSLFEKSTLLGIAHSQELQEIVSSFFGFSPTIRTLEVWLTTYVEGSTLEGTNYFHRDGDDFRLLKCFIPLTEITDMNGPFEYLLNSVWQFSPNEPFRDLSQHDLIKNDRLFFEYRAFTFTAQPGCFLLANTKGLHRARPILSGSRIMFSISFTSPTPYERVLL